MVRFLFLLLISAIWLPLLSQHRYTIDGSKTFQTIDGFGASDAWSNEFLLKMNDSLRNLSADLLFSRSLTSEGSFKGIGLSIWRNNIGAGSSEEGDSSGITDNYRRTECYLDNNGKYDWNKQAGVRWLIMAARARGLEKLVLFSNSPPVSMTKNRRAYSSIRGESNLSLSEDGKFAEFLVKSISHFESENIHVDFVSPVNEPEWGWCSSDCQEGCPYRNNQIADIAMKIDKGLTEKSLKTEVMVPESGLLIFANSGMRFKPGRQNQINEFFRRGSNDFLGDHENTARIICAHGYFTEWPLWLMKHIRRKTAEKCRKNDIKYWMSEYCILRKTREIEGGGRDTGMKTALYVSRIIHHDLVYGNASAWCWWLGLSSAEFKDGLIYVNREGTHLITTKTLWALGNYSQFIHPGAKRIEVKGSYDRNFFVSAFRNEGSEDIVMVVVNMKPEKQSLELSGLKAERVKAWETTETASLKKRAPELEADRLFVAPSSVTTFIINQ